MRPRTKNIPIPSWIRRGSVPDPQFGRRKSYPGHPFVRNRLSVEINVLDAKNLRRGLLVALQLIEMGLPVVLILNMMDEAKSRGIEIDRKAVKEIFGLPVIAAVATRKKGLEQLFPALKESRKSPYAFQYSPSIEEGITTLLPLLPPASISGRSLALMLLAGDETLRPWLEKRLGVPDLERIEAVCSQYRKLFPESLSYRINVERLEKIDQLLPQIQTGKALSVQGLGRRLGEWSTHRVNRNYLDAPGPVFCPTNSSGSWGPISPWVSWKRLSLGNTSTPF